MSGKLFIVSAPCGAGKSTLVKAVLEELRFDVPIEQVITYTTRAPRKNEEHGRDYYFIDSTDFEQRMNNEFFLEWSNAYGAYYGSARSIIEECKKGRSYFLILDRAGAQRVLATMPEAVLIWIEVSYFYHLKDRLMRRATETTEQIEKRLLRSKIEIELERQEPLYHYTVKNDDFGTAKLTLLMIVMHELAHKNSLIKID